MRIRIIAVGNKMPGWVQQGYDEYAKRFGRDFTVEIVELPLAVRGKNFDVARALEKEGETMLSAIGKNDQIIALDVKGKSFDTPALSSQLEHWRLSGDDFSLLIGGPEGLAPACLNAANKRWSLSELTLPHPLVRIVIIEQLYRAWTIIQNHPYHK